MIQMIKHINFRTLRFLILIAVVAAGSFGTPSSGALAGQGNNKQSRAKSNNTGSVNNQSRKAIRKHLSCQECEDALEHCPNPGRWDSGCYINYNECLKGCQEAKNDIRLRKGQAKRHEIGSCKELWDALPQACKEDFAADPKNSTCGHEYNKCLASFGHDRSRKQQPKP